MSPCTRRCRYIVYPYGQRRAPNPIAGNRPINRPVQPLTKAAFFDVFGHPMDLLVGRHKLVLIAVTGRTRKESRDKSTVC